MPQVWGPVAVLFAVFGLIFWIMIFIQTYLHFPKMEKGERLLMDLKNATLLLLAVGSITAISLYVLLKFFLGLDM